MYKLPRERKIVFFSPHPDDDAVSAGAFLHFLSRKNEILSFYHNVSPKGVKKRISTTKKIELRKREARNACKVLDIVPFFLDLNGKSLKEKVKKVKEVLKREEPDIIFIPYEKDVHPTHRETARVVLMANKKKGRKIWFYETWTPMENPNFIFFFGENLMKIKLKAIRKHRSQIERMNLDGAIKGLNSYRGILSYEILKGFGKFHKGRRYAEAFFFKEIPKGKLFYVFSP